MSTHKALPLMVPDKEVVLKSLRFRERISKPMRNFKYAVKQLKDIPLFIWVDKNPLPSEELAEAYLNGF